MRQWIRVVPGTTYVGLDGRHRKVTAVVRRSKIEVHYEQSDLTLETIKGVCSDSRFKAWAARDHNGELLVAKEVQ